MTSVSAPKMPRASLGRLGRSILVGTVAVVAVAAGAIPAAATPGVDQSVLNVTTLLQAQLLDKVGATTGCQITAVAGDEVDKTLYTDAAAESAYMAIGIYNRNTGAPCKGADGFVGPIRNTLTVEDAGINGITRSTDTGTGSASVFQSVDYLGATSRAPAPNAAGVVIFTFEAFSGTGVPLACVKDVWLVSAASAKQVSTATCASVPS